VSPKPQGVWLKQAAAGFRMIAKTETTSCSPVLLQALRDTEFCIDELQLI